jgi:hypothetical protein
MESTRQRIKPLRCNQVLRSLAPNFLLTLASVGASKDVLAEQSYPRYRPSSVYVFLAFHDQEAVFGESFGFLELCNQVRSMLLRSNTQRVRHRLAREQYEGSTRADSSVGLRSYSQNRRDTLFKAIPVREGVQCWPILFLSAVELHLGSCESAQVIALTGLRS